MATADDKVYKHFHMQL